MKFQILESPLNRPGPPLALVPQASGEIPSPASGKVEPYLLPDE